MNKRIYLPILFFFSCTLCAIAQTIQLNFPHFAKKEYAFSFMKGGEKDTIQTGTMGPKGEATLIIPEKYKGYKGACIWNLEDLGEISFIINNENFTISCTEAYPTDENITYQGSIENDFRKTNYSREQKLIKKIQLVNYGLSLYSKEDSIYHTFEKEILHLKNEFETLQSEISMSKLYAARFLKIIDFANGITDRLLQTGQGDTGIEALMNAFSEKINMEDMYTSGIWLDALYFTMELYPDQSTYAKSMIRALERTKSQVVFECLATDVIKLTEMYGFTEAQPMIATYLRDSGRITNPSESVAKAIESLAGVGKKAPAIGDLNLSKVLVIFYDSQCGNCIEEIENMALFYPKLQAQGYDVISISADATKGLFEFTAKNLPWKNKLCDFKSFEGEHFVNYGIIGTPTIIHINENGMIEGAYANVLDIGIINI